MAEKHYEVASLKVADIIEETGLPDTFTDVGEIFAGTMSITYPDNTVTDLNTELEDMPFARIKKKAAPSLAFQLVDTSADNMAIFLGGTVTAVALSPDLWNAPSTVPQIEKAFQITTVTGQVVVFNRVDVEGKFMPAFGKNGVSLIDVKGTIMQPLISSVPPMTSQDVTVPA